MKRLLLFSIVGLTVFASCKEDDGVTVSTEIKIDEGETIQMIYGESMQLHATRYPEKSLSSIKEWSSSAPNVVTVSTLGNITAVGEGEATITISTVDDLSASCRVIVTVINIEEIDLDKSKYEIQDGGTMKINANVTPADASYKNALAFKSTDEAVAKVNQDGEIQAVSPGKCKIEVTSKDGKNAVCDVEVKPISVVDLVVKLSGEIEINLSENKTYKIDAYVLPKNASNWKLIWTTSDEKIATVEDGVVTGVAEGTATITVTSEDGGISKSYTVNVVNGK